MKMIPRMLLRIPPRTWKLWQFQPEQTDSEFESIVLKSLIKWQVKWKDKLASSTKNLSLERENITWFKYNHTVISLREASRGIPNCEYYLNEYAFPKFPSVFEVGIEDGIKVVVHACYGAYLFFFVEFKV